MALDLSFRKDSCTQPDRVPAIQNASSSHIIQHAVTAHALLQTGALGELDMTLVPRMLSSV